MNVGQRRQYEANKKKQKENKEKFAILFKAMVKNHLINLDYELHVLDLTENYEEHLSNIQTIKSQKRLNQQIEQDLMESQLQAEQSAMAQTLNLKAQEDSKDLSPKNTERSASKINLKKAKTTINKKGA